MTAHPIDTAIVDGVDVAKSSVRGYEKQYVRLTVGDADGIRNVDFSGQYGGIYVKSVEALFDFDASDTTSADDGTFVIIDAGGNRFRRIIGFMDQARATVRAATTANITIATALNNGDALDGLTLATSDRVLVKDQTVAAQNGVYVVGVTPARATDFDSYDEHAGALISVLHGVANTGKLFFGAINAGGTLGTTDIVFAEIAGTPGPAGSAFVSALSTTSLAISVASKTFTLADVDPRGWAVGARLRATSAASPTTNWMEGPITAYSHPTLTISVDKIAGSGTHTDWVLNLAGEPGAAGSVSGSTGSTDNVILRADGTGGATAQAGTVTNDDSGNLYPNTTDTGALGLAANMWSDVFLALGAVINFNNGDVTITHAANLLAFAGASSGYSVDAKFFPAANDGAALGDTTHNFSDLFLASGSVINWNAGDLTLTHSSNDLTLAGGTLTLPNTGLHLLDTDASHDLIVVPGSNITADRTLSLVTGDTDITVELTDAGADKLMFWDDSASKWTALTLNSGLVISGTNIWAVETFGIALSDETTAITTGTNKATFSLPYAFTIDSVYATLNTVSSSGIPTVDIKEAGTTILSTKLTIDANEKTSGTAATPAVISDASIAAFAEIGFDITVAGTGAKGLKVFISGHRTS